MSDARCEPPVHLREVDGWHWVQIADWPATVNRWVWDAHEGIGFWHPHISERTRYVSPVATPDELTRLRAELAAARELLSQGLDLCVRARRMDQRAQELLDWQSRNPHITKSATLPLWAEEQYQTDLAEWENAARAALGDPA